MDVRGLRSSSHPLYMLNPDNGHANPYQLRIDDHPQSWTSQAQVAQRP